MYVLYLDKLNAKMEQMFLDHMPKRDDVEVHFLNPVNGEPGELSKADILIDTTFQVTSDVLKEASNCKLIQRTGIGLDMIDVSCAKSKNIPISYCPGFNSVSVAELAVSDILALYRRIPFMAEKTLNLEWRTWTHRHESYELTGKTVGVISVGKIGQNVIKRIKGFDTKIYYYDPFRLSEEKEQELGVAYMNFDDLFPVCDVIVLGGLPLNSKTQGMVGRKQIQSMKKTAILVDTARELLVDLEALADALIHGDIMGAAIDTFSPLPANHPIYRAKGTNFILTPHIGAATYDNYDRVFNLCSANILHLLNNEPLEYLFS